MFNPANFTFDLPDIQKHLHVNKKRPETLAGQQRLLRKWQLGRDRLFANTRLSADEMDAWQLERIALLVDIAFSTHPFYHQLYKSVGFKRGDLVTWEDYNALPTISKKDIIQNYDMFTGNLDQKFPENLSARTSGSSGQALTTNFDPAMVDHDLLHCMRFDEQMLGRKRADSEWYYKIFVAAPYYSSLDNRFPTFTVSNECPPEAVLVHLHKIRPAILAGFPSYLLKLGSLIQDPRELGIRAIATVSESSTLAERRRIAEQFDAKVYNEYASVELCLIATECHKERHHIVSDNVRVDVLNPDETGMGEIVATNLNNTFMPFIRYRQGDTIRMDFHAAECECGNRFRYIESFLGRSDQILESCNVGKVRSDLVMALYDRTLLTAASKIDEFQIIQTKPDEVMLLLVPTSGHSHADQGAVCDFVSGLKAIFKDPDLNVRIEELKVIPPNKSHKRRLIENRIRYENV